MGRDIDWELEGSGCAKLGTWRKWTVLLFAMSLSSSVPSSKYLLIPAEASEKRAPRLSCSVSKRRYSDENRLIATPINELRRRAACGSTALSFATRTDAHAPIGTDPTRTHK